MPRAERQRLPITGQRPGEVAPVVVDNAQVEMIFGESRLERDGLLDKSYRGRGLAGPVAEEPQEMQRIGMIWFDGENRPVQRLSLRQVAALMAAQARAKASARVGIFIPEE